jgi:hypothetical protein
MRPLLIGGGRIRCGAVALDTCTSSTAKGTSTSNVAGTTPSGTISELTSSGCTATTDTVLVGGLKVAAAGSGAGTVSANAKKKSQSTSSAAVPTVWNLRSFSAPSPRESVAPWWLERRPSSKSVTAAHLHVRRSRASLYLLGARGSGGLMADGTG